MPIYQHAAYSGETIILDNGTIRLEMHKRPTGWGWGEIFSASGKCIGVLDHLGELMLRDQEIPMRLEAGEVVREKKAAGEVLTFKVESSIVKEKLKGTSFEPWLNYPLDLHCMTGEVTITMPPKGGVIFLSYRLLSQANQYAALCARAMAQGGRRHLRRSKNRRHPAWGGVAGWRGMVERHRLVQRSLGDAVCAAPI